MDFYFNYESQGQYEMRDLSYMPLYELVWNNRIESVVINEEEEKDTENSFDFGLKLLTLEDETDDLIVEREKKSYYKSNNNEEEGGLQQLDNKRDSHEKRYAYLLRTISELICSSQFNISGRYIGEDSPFCNISPPNTFPEFEIEMIEELTSDKVIEELLVKTDFNMSTKEALDEMYAHLSHENEAVAENIAK